MPTYVVKNDFPQIALKLKAQARISENIGARVLAALAIAAAPVDKGDLRRSIRANGKEVTASSGHAGYQQFGTEKMPAHPYLWNGVRQAQAAQMAVLAKLFGVFA